MMEKLPSASTTPLPISKPAASLTMTVLPTSPLPVRVRPSGLTAKPVGASGAVVSPDTTLPPVDTLPAASVWVTASVSPLVCAGSRVISKLPSAPTGPEPITLPAASFTVTVLPTSPLPLRVRPSALTPKPVGASGAVVSPATTLPTCEMLPALSVRVTPKVSPLICALSRVIEKLPSSPTVPVPITVPAGSLIVTVEPGSPLPVSARPSSLTARLVGASGAVVSPAITLIDGEVRPPGLVRVTPRVSPLFCAVPRVTSKLPSFPTVPVPITLPAESLIVTVEPGSPLPVTDRPSALTTRPVGASGATASPTTTGVAVEMLPALSVKVTSRVVPLPWAASRVTSKLPSAPTTAVPTCSPAAFLTITVLPASPLPVRVRPSALTAILVGASGAVVSPATTLPTCEMLPALSVRVTPKVSPLV